MWKGCCCGRDWRSYLLFNSWIPIRIQTHGRPARAMRVPSSSLVLVQYAANIIPEPFCIRSMKIAVIFFVACMYMYIFIKRDCVDIGMRASLIILSVFAQLKDCTRKATVSFKLLGPLLLLQCKIPPFLPFTKLHCLSRCHIISFLSLNYCVGFIHEICELAGWSCVKVAGWSCVKVARVKVAGWSCVKVAGWSCVKVARWSCVKVAGWSCVKVTVVWSW